jgi:nucleotidyltransferase substrate binding protein (TIGR01987 family)
VQENLDIRWRQRFANFEKALNKLIEAVNYVKTDIDFNENSISDIVLDEIIKEGLIQRFEYTHELAWNLMKDYAEFQGNSDVGGSRDATREAFKIKLFDNGHVWMDMIKSKNITSHTYNEDVANEIYSKIINQYFDAFLDFKNTMLQKMNK